VFRRKWQDSLEEEEIELFCEHGSAWVMKCRMLVAFPPEEGRLDFRIKDRNRRGRGALLRALALAEW